MPTTSAWAAVIASTTLSSPWVCVAPYQMLKVMTFSSTGGSVCAAEGPAAASDPISATAAPAAASTFRTPRLPDGAERQDSPGRYASAAADPGGSTLAKARADLIFTGGAVYTVDAARRWAQAGRR